MNVKATKEIHVDGKELRAVLEILPRGRAYCKVSQELCDILAERGVPMTPRKLREAVRRLRFDHNVIVIGIPGDGYWIATCQEDLDAGLAYFSRMAKEHVDTFNVLKRAWFEQPLKGGEQLELYEGGNGEKSIPVQTPEGVAKLPGGIAIKCSNRTCSLTPEQAKFAAILYWQVGLSSFQAVAERLSQEFKKRIPKDRIQYFWDKLGLPRRSRGGWGNRCDCKKLEACLRRIEAHFAENGEEQT